MNVVHEDVEKLVDKELAAATEKFGLHHSWHEKAAVVGEELEESCEEMENLVDSMKFAWKQTRGNETDYIKEQAYNGVYDAAVRLSIEAIQVAAMAKKEIGTNKPKATKGTASTGINGQIAYICNACGGHVGRDARYCGNCGAYFGE